jgi:hypothetical protein
MIALIDAMRFLMKFLKDLPFALIYLVKELLLDILYFLKNFRSGFLKGLWHGLRTDWRERFIVGYYIFIAILFYIESKIDWVAVERWFR